MAALGTCLRQISKISILQILVLKMATTLTNDAKTEDSRTSTRKATHPELSVAKSSLPHIHTSLGLHLVFLYDMHFCPPTSHQYFCLGADPWSYLEIKICNSFIDHKSKIAWTRHHQNCSTPGRNVPCTLITTCTESPLSFRHTTSRQRNSIIIFGYVCPHINHRCPIASCSRKVSRMSR